MKTIKPTTQPPKSQIWLQAEEGHYLLTDNGQRVPSPEVLKIPATDLAKVHEYEL